MAYATDISISTQSGLTARVSTAFNAARAYFARRAVYNETYSELSALSNRELADLGMSRSEIRRVAMEAANDI